MKKSNRPIQNKLLIQHINFHWDKSCRGGAGAVLRSHYPKAAVLPEEYFSYYSVGVPVHYKGLLQKTDGIHILKDCRDIKKPRNDNTIRSDPFEISFKNNKAEVYYRYDLHHGALPERKKYDPAVSSYIPLCELAFELEQGDYGRAVCNGRFTDWDTGSWWYETDILNIMLISDSALSPDIFLVNEPNKNYSQTAMLW